MSLSVDGALDGVQRSENGESSFVTYGHDAASPSEATPQSKLRSASR